MDPFVLLTLMNLGSKGLRGLSGDKTTTASYQLSPMEKGLYELMMKQYQGGVPGSVTLPFRKAAKSAKQHYARQPGSSALVSDMLAKIGAKESEAVMAHKTSLLPMMLSLLKGTGTTTSETPTDWGALAGEGTGDFAMLLGLMKALKRGGGLMPVYD